MWCRQWVCHLFKKRSVFDPGNYRGLQITSQLSKLVERIIGGMCLPRLVSDGLFGENQFAYTPKRSARDALLYLVLTWILCFAQGCRVGIYCSDVSGAFDKVPAKRLLQKPCAWLPLQYFFDVIASWLRSRTARVVVGGASSTEVVMNDMVYQGTVWGPWLWNAFFADVAHVLRQRGCKEVVFADDLNAFKVFDIGNGSAANLRKQRLTLTVRPKKQWKSFGTSLNTGSGRAWRNGTRVFRLGVELPAGFALR